jgi:hypothetical protein
MDVPPIRAVALHERAAAWAGCAAPIPTAAIPTVTAEPLSTPRRDSAPAPSAPTAEDSSRFSEVLIVQGPLCVEGSAGRGSIGAKTNKQKL